MPLADLTWLIIAVAVVLVLFVSITLAHMWPTVVLGAAVVALCGR